MIHRELDPELTARFEEAIREHEAGLRGTVHKVTNGYLRQFPYLSADDVYQETTLRMFQNFESYDPELGRITTWAATIAQNYCIDLLRRKRIMTTPFPSSEDDAALGVVGDVEDPASAIGWSGLYPPERRVLQSELRQPFLEALSQLSPAYRTHFIACELEDRPYQEIAARLDEPLGTVKNRIHRSRREMRERFAEQLEI